MRVSDAARRVRQGHTVTAAGPDLPPHTVSTPDPTDPSTWPDDLDLMLAEIRAENGEAWRAYKRARRRDLPWRLYVRARKAIGWPPKHLRIEEVSRG